MEHISVNVDGNQYEGDVEFRKHLVTVLTKRAVATAAGISS